VNKADDLLFEEAAKGGRGPKLPPEFFRADIANNQRAITLAQSPIQPSTRARLAKLGSEAVSVSAKNATYFWCTRRLSTDMPRA
jgi:hypothetical protein